MNDIDYMLYREYDNKYDLMDLIYELDKRALSYIIEENNNLISATANHPLTYSLFVKQTDLQKIKEIEKQFVILPFASIPTDYYLHENTDKELLELISDRSSCSPLDYAIAREILKKRQVVVDYDNLLNQKTKLLIKQHRKIADNRTWLIIIYVLALLGSIIGIIAGLHILYRKTTINNTRVHFYPKHIRIHVPYILLIGIISCLFWYFFDYIIDNY
ncbi:hypothetical protein [Myroides injenensis]|uniref:hypothetical protein n=1 Tax=Myroides injenensis TaxID=1183151 RepID=UPI000289C880|nr:hypothetical protein [Myroides injenensis]